MAMKHTQIFRPKAFEHVPKLAFSVLKYTIWQPWNQVRSYSIETQETGSSEKNLHFVRSVLKTKVFS
jgi:hypothetical protein